jgi:DNA-binding transcriptional MerR regulator
MRYLIKDLSKMTGVKGFTIRKWQERYSIFQPQMANNGYWYYSNEDYTVLSKIVKLLESGERISNIAALGRDNILKIRNDQGYNDAERQLLQWIMDGNFSAIERYLDEKHDSMGFKEFIRHHAEHLVILAGRAWQDGLITVAEENSLTKWLVGYIHSKISKFEVTKRPVWLVSIFPGDPHEIGALLHYAILRSKKVPVKYVGSIPIEHLVKELTKTEYRVVSISMALAQPLTKVEKLKTTLLKKTKVKRIYFGGRGYKLAKYGICRER